MQKKKLNILQLNRLYKLVRKQSEKSIGIFVYKGLRIQVSRHNVPNSARVLALYHRRREKGLCIACGKKVKRKNQITGKLFRLCDYHRRKIDRK